MGYTIKNWRKFQHYNHRRPPWIKLYREILDDPEWNTLEPAAAKALVMLWLIGSEDDGKLPASKTLAFRLRQSEPQTRQQLAALSHWIVSDDASTMLAPCAQHATPETETERERETEKETEADGGITEQPSLPIAPPQPIITYPCEGKAKEWDLTETQLAQWIAIYPSLGRAGILQECRMALGWITAATDGSRKKTASGMPRFLVAWLNKTVNNRKGLNNGNSNGHNNTNRGGYPQRGLVENLAL